MKKYSDLEYLRLPKWKQLLYALVCFIVAIPSGIWGFIKKTGKLIADFFIKVKDICVEIVTTFIYGDWKTKVSYLVMGFGNIARGQILRGVLFLLFEVVFIFYMVTTGIRWMSKLDTLGDVEQQKVWVDLGGIDVEQTIPGDSSFKILLYGVLSIFFIVAFVYTWYINIKQNRIAESIIKSGKKLKSGKQDLRSLVDDQFHKTLLALPMTGILIFTAMPIIFMILVAFTNFDGSHNGFTTLFTWVGLESFNELLAWSSGSIDYSATFGEILTWTLMWAFFATFTNYFLGIFVAMMINKKGIVIKKFWRTCLVMTIAIPQFISLLYVSKMFAPNGIVNGILMELGWIEKALPFWTDPTWARVTVIIINIWIGIPYLMLIATGVLMNIPQDLYESAKIDGAGAIKQFTKITLPYMLFITGPYLLTQFTGNMNNFNVIYLLTGGGPNSTMPSPSGVTAGHTDLLVTWLFKITNQGNTNYALGAVIGIMVFVVIAAISLIVYNLLPSNKNEEDFQ